MYGCASSGKGQFTRGNVRSRLRSGPCVVLRCRRLCDLRGVQRARLPSAIGPPSGEDGFSPVGKGRRQPIAERRRQAPLLVGEVP